MKKLNISKQDKLIEEGEKLKRTYEENGNLAANPAKWEISVINYNQAIEDYQNLIKSKQNE